MANFTNRVSLAIVGAGALASLLSGCAGTATPSAGAESPVTGFGHVHGLGYDPSTGRTYAATHNGVWLLPTQALPATFGNGEINSQPDKPQQIAGRAQDTMGFTITDTGLLLASGHPDPQEQPALNPPNLGLISSTDGAETWEDVSLRGDTDFHDLAATSPAEGELRVYGYDATRSIVRISDTGGRSWSGGAALELRDLAADPTNPDRLLATTATGLMASDDAGKTFEKVAGGPPLYLVAAMSSSTGGGFVGVDTGGTIWHTGADGTWVSAGIVQGAAEALAFVGGQSSWILVSDDRGVVASDDYGSTWITLVGK